MKTLWQLNRPTCNSTERLSGREVWSCSNIGTILHSVWWSYVRGWKSGSTSGLRPVEFIPEITVCRTAPSDSKTFHDMNGGPSFVSFFNSFASWMRRCNVSNSGSRNPTLLQKTGWNSGTPAEQSDMRTIHDFRRFRPKRVPLLKPTITPAPGPKTVSQEGGVLGRARRDRLPDLPR